MKPQNTALALALMAALAGQFTLNEHRAAREQFQSPAGVAEIDFTDLHRQAAEALTALQQADHNKLAMVAAPIR